jgi:stage III sporulation protein SpoIIIAA
MMIMMMLRRADPIRVVIQGTGTRRDGASILGMMRAGMSTAVEVQSAEIGAMLTREVLMLVQYARKTL